MENIEFSPEVKGSIELEQDGLHHFIETRKWTMFMSILGLIFLGFVLILGVIIIMFAPMNSPEYSIYTVVPLFLLCFVYFFPVYYLLKFSQYAKQATNKLSKNDLTTALKYLKIHFRYMGIMVIVILFIYLIMGLILLITKRFPGVG
jgi:hypothetical protein